MTDNLNPNYYKFPNGAETIDISQYLSGCGSQAVQYVVRSTRIDKELKGNPLEDLRKAIWFIEQEISRLEDFQDAEDGEATSADREEALVEGAVFNITLNTAEDIASDGLDLDDAADAVGSADAKHVGIVRAAKVIASNPGLYI